MSQRIYLPSTHYDTSWLRVAASALLALVRPGYLTSCYGAEAGVAGRLSAGTRGKFAEIPRPSKIAIDVLPNTKGSEP